MSATESDIPLEQWPRLLTELLRSDSHPPNRLVWLEETDSTQDAARRMDAQLGDLIIARRQIAGRGRLGREWIDNGQDGVAMTAILPRERPERMAIAAALAVHNALWPMCMDYNARVGIKWPNDIVIQGRKVAGILIEQFRDRALVGVGVNVNQQAWPGALQASASSLHQAGVLASRLTVMLRLIMALKKLPERTDEELISEFAHWDVLTGATCGFRIGEREIRGQVLRVDPMNGLVVLTENEGEVWLPAATTTVIKD